MADYPGTLPTAPVAWSVPAISRGNLESEMQSGAVRQRRQTTLNIATVEMALVMTLTQYATWMTFWRDTLGEGSGEFNMPVWDGHSGCPVRVVRLRNGGRFTPARVGNKMRVSFSLDVYGFTS